MEGKIALKVQFPVFIEADKSVRRPGVSLPLSQKLRERQGRPMLISCQNRRASNSQKHVALDPSGRFRNSPAPVLESGSFPPSEKDLILKNKSQEIQPYLNGRCIYLVGMMGSGKTTIGKILAEVLGYSFCDSDVLVELAVEGTSVAEIFNLHGEGFFRNIESETLKKLSLMRRIVVSTGGGAVIRPINWKYMETGISVWLDVPLEALAQRISAVGTNSRPLLHDDSGDAYKTALTRLSNLWKERGDAYANANARVSLEEIAAKLGHRDVTNITPTLIAIEALEQIEAFLQGGNGNGNGNGMDMVEL